MSDFILEAVGIYGIVMVLGAYALNTFGFLSAKDTKYQMMNLTGGAAFVYYTLVKTAWASLFVNVVWVVIAVIGLWRIMQTHRKKDQS